jgi:hypothetical protein
MLDQNGNIVSDPTYGDPTQGSGYIPPGVSIDPVTGMGSDGQDYSGLLEGP